MLLFYIRHGDPLYDPDLITPLGEAQAESVAHRLALFGVDEIYSSPSNRALQTAAPACRLLGKEPVLLDFLNENLLGGLQIPSETAKTKMDWVWSHPVYSRIMTGRDVRELGDAWYRHPALEPFHFEKVILPINEQLDALLASQGYTHDPEKGLYQVTGHNEEKRIAIFAHECIGKIVMSHLLDVPFPSYAEHFDMHTTGLTVVFFDEGVLTDERMPRYARARVLTLSNDSHLYRDGLSMVHRFTHLRIEY
ncbi:MAG: histidine phosphatase family protein [Lachnospiraceae bacterium]|nr:histidine phosphatase family protein [Lachnospiraceae bacterium]